MEFYQHRWVSKYQLKSSKALTEKWFNYVSHGRMHTAILCAGLSGVTFTKTSMVEFLMG
jgi:hypothetical protein